MLWLSFTGYVSTTFWQTHRCTENHYYGDSDWRECNTTSLDCFLFLETRKQLQKWLQIHSSTAVRKPLHESCTDWEVQSHENVTTLHWTDFSWFQLLEPYIQQLIICWSSNYWLSNLLKVETGFSSTICHKSPPVVAISHMQLHYAKSVSRTSYCIEHQIL